MLCKLRSHNKSLKTAEKHKAFRIWNEPLIHFFVLGLVVFGLHSVFEPKPEVADDPFLVEVSSADIEWFRTMWRKRMGREPTVEELRGQVNQLIREVVLSREAVSIGLDEDDMVVRRRLAQRMDFLFKDLSELTEPTDAELQSYLQEKLNRYEIPSRLNFIHIYFNADKRGRDRAANEVRQLIEKLNAKEGVPANVAAMGDSFLLQSNYTNKTVSEIRVMFGHQFAEMVWKQGVGTWQGPIPSGYGLHAVYVQERTDANLPELVDIRERLKADWMAERQREIAGRAYEKLRKRYQVLLEGMPYDLDIRG